MLHAFFFKQDYLDVYNDIHFKLNKKEIEIEIHFA